MKMSLNKIVKKNLQGVVEVKKTRLTESKICKSRYDIISESVNFHSKIQTTKFFNKLFLETKNLIKMGINESVINEDLITVLKGLTDEDGKTIELLKEKLISFLSSKLQPEEFENDVLISSITDLSDEEFPMVFTDKSFLPRKIADVFVSEFSQNRLDGLTDDMKEIIIKQIDTDKVKREVEDRYFKSLESFLNSIESNMDSKLKDIRDSVLS